MAVTQQSTEVDLIYKVQTGTSTDGSSTTATRTINNTVNPSLSNDDAYDVASQIAGLQIYPLVSVIKRTDVELVNSEA